MILAYNKQCQFSRCYARFTHWVVCRNELSSPDHSVIISYVGIDHVVEPDAVSIVGADKTMWESIEGDSEWLAGGFHLLLFLVFGTF
jgi:hypothetical protein